MKNLEIKLVLPENLTEVKATGKEVLKGTKKVVVKGIQLVSEELDYLSKSPMFNKVKKGLASSLLKLGNYLSK